MDPDASDPVSDQNAAQLGSLRDATTKMELALDSIKFSLELFKNKSDNELRDRVRNQSSLDDVRKNMSMFESYFKEAQDYFECERFSFFYQLNLILGRDRDRNSPWIDPRAPVERGSDDRQTCASSDPQKFKVPHEVRAESDRVEVYDLTGDTDIQSALCSSEPLICDSSTADHGVTQPTNTPILSDVLERKDYSTDLLTATRDVAAAPKESLDSLLITNPRSLTNDDQPTVFDEGESDNRGGATCLGTEPEVVFEDPKPGTAEPNLETAFNNMELQATFDDSESGALEDTASRVVGNDPNPEVIFDDLKSKVEFIDSEPEYACDEPEPEGPFDDLESEALFEKPEPEVVSDDSDSEITGSDSKPEGTFDDLKSEVEFIDSGSEFSVHDPEPEVVFDDLKPEDMLDDPVRNVSINTLKPEVEFDDPESANAFGIPVIKTESSEDPVSDIDSKVESPKGEIILRLSSESISKRLKESRDINIGEEMLQYEKPAPRKLDSETRERGAEDTAHRQEGEICAKINETFDQRIEIDATPHVRGSWAVDSLSAECRSVEHNSDNERYQDLPSVLDDGIEMEINDKHISSEGSIKFDSDASIDSSTSKFSHVPSHEADDLLSPKIEPSEADEMVEFSTDEVSLSVGKKTRRSRERTLRRRSKKKVGVLCLPDRIEGVASNLTEAVNVEQAASSDDEDMCLSASSYELNHSLKTESPAESINDIFEVSETESKVEPADQKSERTGKGGTRRGGSKFIANHEFRKVNASKKDVANSSAFDSGAVSVNDSWDSDGSTVSRLKRKLKRRKKKRDLNDRAPKNKRTSSVGEDNTKYLESLLNLKPLENRKKRSLSTESLAESFSEGSNSKRIGKINKKMKMPEADELPTDTENSNSETEVPQSNVASNDFTFEDFSENRCRETLMATDDSCTSDENNSLPSESEDISKVNETANQLEEPKNVSAFDESSKKKRDYDPLLHNKLSLSISASEENSKKRKFRDGEFYDRRYEKLRDKKDRKQDASEPECRLSDEECSDSSVSTLSKNEDASSFVDVDSDCSSLPEDDPDDYCKIISVHQGLSFMPEDSSVQTMSLINEPKPRTDGRKNIRKVISWREMTEEAKQASKEEQERKRRILEKEMLLSQNRSLPEVEKVILDFEKDTMRELVSVHPGFLQVLKEHQVNGVKFMWNTCFESVEQVKSTSGSGCVLAHCMGLGKSLQIVTLVHTLINHPELNLQRILIVCPKTLVLNWCDEFKTWQEKVIQMDPNSKCVDSYDLVGFPHVQLKERRLRDWHIRGGAMILSYSEFRSLVRPKNPSEQLQGVFEAIQKYLVNPGPDVVVFDEGHMLKNGRTSTTKAANMVRAKRRIVLTGTPMQNNLMEYFCMVNLVKPKYLGAEKEFRNRFFNPIMNGQFVDSTPQDVKIMKSRAFVLHKQLDAIVQRFDSSHLKGQLPDRFEYVVKLRATVMQAILYKQFVNSLKIDPQTQEVEAKRQLINSDKVLSQICNHPKTVAGSLEATGNTEDQRNLKADWQSCLVGMDLDKVNLSPKTAMFFKILKKCSKVGDKLLVFSQHLKTLDLLEFFLKRSSSCSDTPPSSGSCFDKRSWCLGTDYFRLDGDTPPLDRQKYCKIFNSDNKQARLFLLSTRAGGLGLNLTGANRAIVFDVSWNPSVDSQSVFRIYRIGQLKPCYIYRFVMMGTMEETKYHRQVSKLSLSSRVIDQRQVERHFREQQLQALFKYNFEYGPRIATKIPQDEILMELLSTTAYIHTYEEHDILLRNLQDEELTEEDRHNAEADYEAEQIGNYGLFAPLFIDDLLRSKVPAKLMKHFKKREDFEFYKSCLGQKRIPAPFVPSTPSNKVMSESISVGLCGLTSNVKKSGRSVRKGNGINLKSKRGTRKLFQESTLSATSAGAQLAGAEDSNQKKVISSPLKDPPTSTLSSQLASSSHKPGNDRPHPPSQEGKTVEKQEESKAGRRGPSACAVHSLNQDTFSYTQSNSSITDKIVTGSLLQPPSKPSKSVITHQQQKSAFASSATVSTPSLHSGKLDSNDLGGSSLGANVRGKFLQIPPQLPNSDLCLSKPKTAGNVGRTGHNTSVNGEAVDVNNFSRIFPTNSVIRFKVGNTYLTVPNSDNIPKTDYEILEEVKQMAETAAKNLRKKQRVKLQSQGVSLDPVPKAVHNRVSLNPPGSELINNPTPSFAPLNSAKNVTSSANNTKTAEDDSSDFRNLRDLLKTNVVQRQVTDRSLPSRPNLSTAKSADSYRSVYTSRSGSVLPSDSILPNVTETDSSVRTTFLNPDENPVSTKPASEVRMGGTYSVDLLIQNNFKKIPPPFVPRKRSESIEHPAVHRDIIKTDPSRSTGVRAENVLSSTSVTEESPSYSAKKHRAIINQASSIRRNSYDDVSHIRQTSRENLDQPNIPLKKATSHATLKPPPKVIEPTMHSGTFERSSTNFPPTNSRNIIRPVAHGNSFSNVPPTVIQPTEHSGTAQRPSNVYSTNCRKTSQPVTHGSAISNVLPKVSQPTAHGRSAERASTNVSSTNYRKTIRPIAHGSTVSNVPPKIIQPAAHGRTVEIPPINVSSSNFRKTSQSVAHGSSISNVLPRVIPPAAHSRTVEIPPINVSSTNFRKTSQPVAHGNSNSNVLPTVIQPAAHSGTAEGPSTSFSSTNYRNISQPVTNGSAVPKGPPHFVPRNRKDISRPTARTTSSDKVEVNQKLARERTWSLAEDVKRFQNMSEDDPNRQELHAKIQRRLFSLGLK